MERLPDSLAIAFWVVGSCWALAGANYMFGGPRLLTLPLVVFGTFTGLVEWLLRQRK
jgi:hypothetical protein